MWPPAVRPLQPDRVQQNESLIRTAHIIERLEDEYPEDMQAFAEQARQPTRTDRRLNDRQ